MDLAGYFARLSNYLNQLASSLREWLGSLDEPTLRLIMVCGLAMLGFFLFLGFIGLIISFARGGRRNDDPQLEANNEASVVMRDMNKRISALAAQAKDEHLYLRQEIAEIKQMITSCNQLEVLYKQIEALSSRMDSHSALMREEYHALRNEALKGRSAARPAQSMVGKLERAELYAPLK